MQHNARGDSCCGNKAAWSAWREPTAYDLRLLSNLIRIAIFLNPIITRCLVVIISRILWERKVLREGARWVSQKRRPHFLHVV